MIMHQTALSFSIPTLETGCKWNNALKILRKIIFQLEFYIGLSVNYIGEKNKDIIRCKDSRILHLCTFFQEDMGRFSSSKWGYKIRQRKEWNLVKKGFTLEKNQRKSLERWEKNQRKSFFCLPIRQFRLVQNIRGYRKDVLWGESGPDRSSGVFGSIEKAFQFCQTVCGLAIVTTKHQQLKNQGH